MGWSASSATAFETGRSAATRTGKPKVTLVDKANAIRAQAIWTRTALPRSRRSIPDIETDHAYIDAACMWMVKNPEWFDVVVTPNLFGDIITDLGAMVQGGMGIAASGNIHPGQGERCSSPSTARRRSTGARTRPTPRHDRSRAHDARARRRGRGGRARQQRRRARPDVGARSRVSPPACTARPSGATWSWTR